jgi:hypothetical protein
MQRCQDQQGLTKAMAPSSWAHLIASQPEGGKGSAWRLAEPPREESPLAGFEWLLPDALPDEDCGLACSTGSCFT